MADKTTLNFDFGAVLNGDGPLGVAVSGGGDSVALLYALAEWGKRPLHVLHFDHGIHSDSAYWAQTVANHAQRLGLPFNAARWVGDKPTTGLSAAARQARHAALAATARHLGIKVICLAHTADDIAEATYMRDEGSNVGSPRTWSPSPVWPHGRGIFLCRPLLNTRRAELRVYLTQGGVTWIDDPANDSPKSLRARARQALQGRGGERPDDHARLSRADVDGVLHDPEGWGALGLLRFNAERFYRLRKAVALHLLATAAVCAGGGDRLPRGDRSERLYQQLPGVRPHTLAGARIHQSNGVIHIHRESGDIGRHGDPQRGEMWDGRFELAQEATATGHDRSRLNEAGQAFLRTLPADLRGTLPMIAGSGPHLALPLYGVSGQTHNGTVTATCWVLPRFLASACRIERETDL